MVRGTRRLKLLVSLFKQLRTLLLLFSVWRKNKEYDEIKGRILAIEVNKQSVWLDCKSRIGNEEGGDQLVQCRSCNLNILKASLVQNVTAYMIIADENGKNLGQFFCSGETRNQMSTWIAEFFRDCAIRQCVTTMRAYWRHMTGTGVEMLGQTFLIFIYIYIYIYI